MTAAAKAAAAWDGLNARQRAYLRCLYDLDQDVEANERDAFAAGGRAWPAGGVAVDHPRLRQRRPGRPAAPCSAPWRFGTGETREPPRP
jgi:hypothetical protein